jgi:uncharacterized RDD family membrane protein YckC
VNDAKAHPSQRISRALYLARFDTFWPRFWAGPIDCLLLWPLFWVGEWVWNSSLSGAATVAWFAFISLLYPVYSVLLHGCCGQTLGKRVMRIKVVDVSEAPLSMKQAFLRDSVAVAFVLFGIVDGFAVAASGRNPSAPAADLGEVGGARFIALFGLCWFVLEVLTMLTNDKRRALHDFIAGSVVVRQSRRGERRRRRKRSSPE